MSKTNLKAKPLGFIAVIAAILLGASLFVACQPVSDGSDTDSGRDVVLQQAFSLDKTAIELTVDSVDVLTLTINNIDDAIQWKSSDDSIATVTVQSAANRATVRGVGEGAALITVSAGDYYVVCAVVVKPGIYITPNKSTIDLWKGATETITVETNYTDALTYTSSNPSIATVSNTGLVSGVGGGSAKITITGGNKTATVTVNVTVPVVTLDNSLVQLLKDDTAQLNATASADGDVEWHSANTAVATVDDTGLVTAIGEGETVITVTFKTAEATCKVKVKGELLTVILDKDTVTLGEDKQSDTITATVTSSASGELSGDDAKVSWSVVSGGSLVLINQDGVVTWKKAANNYGTATVRATSVKDPDSSVDCTVNIPSPYADWIAISDKASLEAALSTGNENKNMYLAADIDLGGAALSGFVGTYNGTFDGMGFTIKNYHGYLCHNLSGTIKNLHVVCTTEGLGDSFGALMHHVNGGGTVKDCLIDVTYVENKSGGIACFSQGTVENVIIFARNTNSVSEAYAGMVQGGTFNNVYYVAYGNVQSGDATAKTEEQIKSAATFDGTWEDGWVIIDGELPQIKNVNVKEPLKVELDKISAELYVGENTTITAIVTPFDLTETEREVVWSSSDEQVATVDKYGVVTAHKAGTATITATSKTENDKSAECEITVNAITLSINAADRITELKKDATKQLNVTVNRGGVVWSSSDPSVATVDQNGLVTAVNDGEVTITVTSALDSTVIDTITFNVSSIVNVTVSINETSLELDFGATTTLHVSVGNSDAGVQWTSSDPDVATVDENGVVTAKGVAGTAIITATAKDDGGSGTYASDTCLVTVAYVDEVITLLVETDENVLIPLNGVVTLAEIATADKGEFSLSLKGADGGVISVEDNKITALSEGTATVVLTWHIDFDSVADKTFDIGIEVYEPTVQLSIDTAKRTLKVGESSAANTLHVTMDNMPSAPDADDITWTSSNTSVVSTVSAGYSDDAYTGVLNAVGVGYTVITATYKVGKIEYKVTCEVAVFEASGTMTAVYNLSTFKTAMTSGGNYYLAHDLDLNGVTVTGSRGGYSGKFDGRGFTVSNFTTSAFFMYSDGGCVIENLGLVCTLSNNVDNEGILGHHMSGGLIKNCYFDVTFGSNLKTVTPALFNHIASGTLENVIVVTHNPGGNGGVYADFYQTDGTVKNMLAYRADSGINNPKKAVDLSEAQLKSAATYNDSWQDNWVITDGELPELMLIGFPQAHRHTFYTEWTTDENNHWHAAKCEHTDEVKDFAAHNTDGRDGECTVCDYLPDGAHRHTYSDEYSFDETHHWIETTCAEHDAMEIDKEGHNTLALGGGCSVCGHSTAETKDLEYSPESGMPTDKWVYWSGPAQDGKDPKISGSSNGCFLTVTFTENNGDWWGRQLFYRSSAITTNAAAKVSMTIVSDVSGSITVNGQVVALEAEVAYKFTGRGSGGTALISVQMGVNGQGTITAATITFSKITVTP